MMCSFIGTLVKKDTLTSNADAGTLVDCELGTMIINDSEDDDNENSTMKSKLSIPLDAVLLS